jgi:hypothetical protein
VFARKLDRGFCRFNGINFLYPQNTSTANTSISLYLSENQIDAQKYGIIYYQGNSQIDFQVEAVIATFHPFAPHSDLGTWTYETSGWSNTQTITILEQPILHLIQPPLLLFEFSWFMILPLFIFTLSIAVIVRFRKTRKMVQHLNLSQRRQKREHKRISFNCGEMSEVAYFSNL